MVTAPPQSGSAQLANAHELPFITIILVSLCAGEILLPWTEIDEIFSPPWFSLLAVPFSFL